VLCYGASKETLVLVVHFFLQVHTPNSLFRLSAPTILYSDTCVDLFLPQNFPGNSLLTLFHSGFQFGILSVVPPCSSISSPLSDFYVPHTRISSPSRTHPASVVALVFVSPRKEGQVASHVTCNKRPFSGFFTPPCYVYRLPQLCHPLKPPFFVFLVEIWVSICPPCFFLSPFALPSLA